MTTRIGKIIDTPRKRPRQLRSRETVDAVLEAAAQLFARDGIATTTNHVAERAGVSIGTVYQYFPNKHALLYALAERHVELAISRLDAVFDLLRQSQTPFEDTVRVLVSELVTLHDDRPALHTLMHVYTPRVPELVARAETLNERAISEVAHHLRRCGKGGANPELVAMTIVHAVDAQLHRVVTGRADRVEEIVRLILKLSA